MPGRNQRGGSFPLAERYTQLARFQYLDLNSGQQTRNNSQKSRRCGKGQYRNDTQFIYIKATSKNSLEKYMNIINEMSSLSPWFSALNEEIKKSICANVKIAHFNKEQFIYRSGEKVTHLVMIKSGSLSAQRSAEGGKNYVLASVGPGFLGHLEWALGLKTSRYDVVCSIKSDLVLIPIENITNLIERDISFCRSIMRYMNISQIIMEEYLYIISISSNIQKVSWILSLIACGYCGLCMAVTVFPISQEKFAETLGVSRQTLNYILKELEKMELISLSREKITILKEKSLRRLSGFSFASDTNTTREFLF